LELAAQAAHLDSISGQQATIPLRSARPPRAVVEVVTTTEQAAAVDQVVVPAVAPPQMERVLRDKATTAERAIRVKLARCTEVVAAAHRRQVQTGTPAEQEVTAAQDHQYSEQPTQVAAEVET